MQNYTQEGKVVTVVAPAAVETGHGVMINSLFGVACNTSLISANVEIALEGVFYLHKLTTEVWAVGEPIYWDNVNFWCSNVAGALLRIGVATAIATNPTTYGYVRLNGCF